MTEYFSYIEFVTKLELLLCFVQDDTAFPCCGNFYRRPCAYTSTGYSSSDVGSASKRWKSVCQISQSSVYWGNLEQIVSNDPKLSTGGP